MSTEACLQGAKSIKSVENDNRDVQVIIKMTFIDGKTICHTILKRFWEFNVFWMRICFSK